MADVLAFPTDRKRRIPCGWLNPHRDPPENVVVFEKPLRATHLRRSPELLLLMAMMTSMDGAQRYRLANEIKRLADRAERQGDAYASEVAEDLMDLHRHLPCHIER